jgi:hypothetical protein
MRVLAFSGGAGDGVGLRSPTFDCSWARPRMWEQYGDNHTGACLLFERGRLEATLMNELGEERIFFGDVTYDREGIAASRVQHVTDERIFDKKQRQKAVADHIDKYRDDFFLLKSDDFETEAEYRVVLKTDDQSPVGYHGRAGLCLRRLRRRACRRGSGARLAAVAEAWSPRVVRPRRRQVAAHVVGAGHAGASLDRRGVSQG